MTSQQRLVLCLHQSSGCCACNPTRPNHPAVPMPLPATSQATCSYSGLRVALKVFDVAQKQHQQVCSPHQQVCSPHLFPTCLTLFTWIRHILSSIGKRADRQASLRGPSPRPSRWSGISGTGWCPGAASSPMPVSSLYTARSRCGEGGIFARVWGGRIRYCVPHRVIFCVAALWEAFDVASTEPLPCPASGGRVGGHGRGVGRRRKSVAFNSRLGRRETL